MTVRRVTLKDGADLDGFRHAVRTLIAHRVLPEEVAWSTSGEPALFEEAAMAEAPPISLPRRVRDLIDLVVCHRDPERYALLYALFWRILHGERELLDVASDPLVHRLHLIAKDIRRDLHKMHAFLRFRKAGDGESEHLIAWFEPGHYILEATADFFVERFRALRWSIVTPVGSLHWNRERLLIGPPGTRADAPDGDAFEAGWRGYYESVFNPARVNPRAMRAEMAQKYWKNMPEAQSIPEMIRNAPSRVREMVEKEAVMPVKRNPEKAVAAMAEQEPKSLAALNRIIAASEPLVPGATRAVLGEGPEGAAIAFVGEQPGDQEDRQGRPFVGPAGQLLDQAMAEAGIDRGKVYVTNAVKHFKFEQRGKKRIHQKPTAGEVKHYRWWLKKELDFVHPDLVVALGATAVLALAGKSLPIIRSRGEAEFGNRRGYITVHPSYLLRVPEDEKRRAYKEFVTDLKRIKAIAA